MMAVQTGSIIGRVRGSDSGFIVPGLGDWVALPPGRTAFHTIPPSKDGKSTRFIKLAYPDNGMNTSAVQAPRSIALLSARQKLPAQQLRPRLSH